MLSILFVPYIYLHIYHGSVKLTTFFIFINLIFSRISHIFIQKK